MPTCDQALAGPARRLLLTGRWRRAGHVALLLLAALLFLRGTPTRAAERPVLVYALAFHNLPFESTDATGQPIGFNVELIRQIGELMGFEVVFQAMPWGDVIQKLMVGKADMAAMVMTRPRSFLFDFATPHHVSPMSIIVRKGNTDIHHFEDLQDKQVLMLADSMVHRELFGKRPGNVPVFDSLTGLRRLAEGHHDAMVELESTALYQIRHHELSNLVLAGSLASPYQYGFAITKGQPALLAQLDEGLRRLKRTGQFQQLHDKWLAGGLRAEQQKQTLLRYAGLLVLALLMLIWGLFKWKSAHTRKLLEQAHHDRLTGLPSRTLLMDRLQRALSRAQRNQTLMAVFFIDLNGFKQINDTLGHAAGDLLLQAVAGRLLQCVRTEDTVARMGGDEFVIVLEQLEQASDTDIIADRILDALRQPFDLNERRVSVSGSLGISLYPRNGTDAETLLQHADEAMYQAKRHRADRRLSNVMHLVAESPSCDRDKEQRNIRLGAPGRP
ncbi:diguanylate cyclase domain-containing protein [Oceanimonas marisflavi]|uniref:diguanylate cyclase domain-containing protein n=1 Tax=Oceanimonas marisflavi TaxID=2059724 RepID=UPI0018E5094E|nr:diguanylate cyclase [Oceanimonas marisflavi]